MAETFLQAAAEQTGMSVEEMEILTRKARIEQGVASRKSVEEAKLRERLEEAKGAVDLQIITKANQSIVYGAVDPKKKVSYDILLKEICEYGKLKGFRFDTTENFQITCGYLAFPYINKIPFKVRCINISNGMDPEKFEVKSF